MITLTPQQQQPGFSPWGARPGLAIPRLHLGLSAAMKGVHHSSCWLTAWDQAGLGGLCWGQRCPGEGGSQPMRWGRRREDN
jgi:hypothetical protein